MSTAQRIDLETAAGLVNSGDTIIVGGFGMTGYPIHIVDALARSDVEQLTYVGNNVGEPGLGGGKLLRNGQIARAVGSFFTSNPEAVAAAQSGDIDFELLPQGTLAEALRAGGAGIGGFYTPAAVGTLLADGQETRTFEGRDMLFVPALRGNVALIRAWKADAAGNLQYRMTENNFNQVAATAADIVVAEVDEIVDIGDLDPNQIHTPACYVDYLVEAKTTLDDLGSSASVSTSNKKVDDARLSMAKAALAELKQGDIVNLGIGIPTLVADLIGPEDGITLHTENGMLGVGPEPESGGAMDYPVNAGKVPVTELPGSSYFDSAASFGMIRGGHVDVAIMGGLQVDEHGNLANWAVPGKPLLGVGGAMDLASGAKKLIVAMTHLARNGTAKVVRECNLPLTAVNAVDVLITDLAVFHFVDGEMRLVRLMPNVNLETLRGKTEADFSVHLRD